MYMYVLCNVEILYHKTRMCAIRLILNLEHYLHKRLHCICFCRLTYTSNRGLGAKLL